MNNNGFGLIGSIIFIFLVGLIIKIVPILLTILLVVLIIVLLSGRLKE